VDYSLTEQQSLIASRTSEKIFLEGPYGSGKTTIGIGHLYALIENGAPADSILVLTPQRTLASTYQDMLTTFPLPAGSEVSFATIGGLAQRMIRLFWPILAEKAGFKNPDQPPRFLTLETAQYYLSKIVTPLREKGYFDTIKIDPNRLLSQILDNLNKSAAVGFASDSFGEKLRAAAGGNLAQMKAYEEAQVCANNFRSFCLAHNLLDFSFQLDLFYQYLWPMGMVKNYLHQSYRHLIYDNIEEDIPIAHDIIQEWLPDFDSALLIYDQDGGFRAFLGADPDSAHGLHAVCDEMIAVQGSWTTSQSLLDFQQALSDGINRRLPAVTSSFTDAFQFNTFRFFPEMVTEICEQVAQLVHQQHVEPEEITILSPFLSDSLRFSLINQLEKLDVPVQTHRPSRSLRDEPATNCLLTLAKLAHPHWQFPIHRAEIRTMLLLALPDIDLVRADLLSSIVSKPNAENLKISTFDLINPQMQDRITYLIGGRYEQLRSWLEEYLEQAPLELDIFISKIFGEVLSQPGFGFHQNPDSAQVAANLVESIRKFRRVVIEDPLFQQPNLGKEYIQTLEDGIVAAQYLTGWQRETQKAVLISPAYTFLMANRAVDYQFWLDVGSKGWEERIDQPLTHPYVLSRQWPEDKAWSDADEQRANRESLEKLTTGLIRRCRKKIVLAASTINEQGNEQREMLIKTLQIIQRNIINAKGQHV
jgi:hypothetical protein